MPITDGIVVKPVGMGDISTALGVASLDLGTLCQAGTINMFAKYKSVKLNTFDVTGRTSGSTYWKAYNEKCGITIPTYTSESALVSGLLNSPLWSHDYPTGGTQYPFRMLDFDGYNPNALTLTPPNGITNYTLDGNNQLTLQWPVCAADTTEDTQLQYSDIIIGGSTLDQMYFGALVYVSSSKYRIMAPTKIADGGLTVTLTDMSTFVGSNIKIAPFVSNKAITTTWPSSPTMASYNQAPIIATISAASPGPDQQWSLSAVVMWNSTNTGINYTLNLTQTIANSVTVYVVLVQGDPNSSTALRTNTHTVSYTATQTEVTGSFTYTRVSGVNYYVQITARTASASTTMRWYQVLENLEPDPRT